MTGPCNRRTLLRTGALAVAGLAGCVGGDTDDPRAGETTGRTTAKTTETTETETTTEAAAPPLAVEDVRVQSSVFYLTTPDSAAVDAPTGTQFVFADLREAESSVLPPTSDDFALVADEREVEGTLEPGTVSQPYMLYWQRAAYDIDEHGGGWVAFEVPDPLDAEEVALTYESEGRTFSEPLGSENVESLAEPRAEFELVDFEVPESVEYYERFEVSLAVENVGEGDGVFRAVLNQTHPLYAPYTIEVEVPAGERREWSNTSNWNADTGTHEVRFDLVSPSETREATVEVAAETTDEE